MTQCPVCMAETFIVINPPKGFETYGTAQAVCRDQKYCEWKSGHVATHGAWEDALEWRAKQVVHGNTLAAATVQR